MDVKLIISAGNSTGPFKIYTDVDNFAVPVITNIPLSAMTAPGGYTATVPDAAKIVRVMSYGTCFKEVDMNITGLTTTTSTSSTTSTSTTLPVPSIYLASAPICRYNNCNDNSSCAVIYEINTYNVPSGAYVNLVTLPPSSFATVSLTDINPTTANVLYSEPSASATPVYFRLELKVGSTVVAYSDASITHQSYWQYIPNCNT